MISIIRISFRTDVCLRSSSICSSGISGLPFQGCKKVMVGKRSNRHPIEDHRNNHVVLCRHRLIAEEGGTRRRHGHTAKKKLLVTIYLKLDISGARARLLSLQPIITLSPHLLYWRKNCSELSKQWLGLPCFTYYYQLPR